MHFASKASRVAGHAYSACKNHQLIAELQGPLWPCSVAIAGVAIVDLACVSHSDALTLKVCTDIKPRGALVELWVGFQDHSSNSQDPFLSSRVLAPGLVKTA